MWWARPAGPALLVVLRADSLDASWGPADQPASGDWQSAQWSLQVMAAPPAPAATGPVAAVVQSGGASSVLRASVRAAFAALRDRLGEGEGGRRFAGQASLTVLLAGPCAGVATLPWSDALFDAASAQQLARAELMARGFEVGADDAVQIDHRPPRGHPRAVFWVPPWLQAEIDLLATEVSACAVSVQSLNLVAAAWALGPGRPRAGAPSVLGILGSGTLQLWPDGDAGALGDTLADTAGGAEAGPRVAALWQRACARSPGLAAQAGLRVLSLDAPPPSAPAASDAVQWWPWPAGAAVRSALDRILLGQARARPVLPADAGEGANDAVRWAWPAWALVGGCAFAAVLLGIGWQRHSEATRLQLQASAPVAAPRQAAPTAAETAAVRAVNAAVRQLNLPLPSLLRALRPPRDLPVVLLALEINAKPGGQEAGGDIGVKADEAGIVKLTAEAPGSRDMTRYVEFLVGRPGIAAAQLVRHEADTAAPDGTLRFEVELSWPR